MPKRLHPAGLAPEHERYWQENYSALDQREFLELVCNQGLVLPVDRLEPASHLPCCWLGQTVIDYTLRERYLAEQRKNLGWRPTKYMLILPSPSGPDLYYQMALHPKSQVGTFIREELERVSIPLTACVATHVCRFDLPRTVNKYSQRHKKSGLAYLQADIDECKPDVIITFGADALKSLFGPKAKLDAYQGNVLEYQTDGGHTAKVVPTYSSLAFLGGHAEISVFRSELRRAAELGEKVHTRKRVETSYRVCRTAREVERLCAEIRQVGPQWIAFDTEYGNQVAREELTETISIQLAWGPGKAAFIQLTDQVEVFRPDPQVLSFECWAESAYKDPWRLFAQKESSKTRAERRYQLYCEREERAISWEKFRDYDFEHEGRFYRAYQPLHSPEDWHRIWYSVQQLLLERRWRIAAHHIRADCEQFERNGYPLTERIEDGLDTMLIHHLLYGDESQGLDLVTRKYLPHLGAFWMELEEYLEDTGCRKKHLQFGYRDIPFKILIPYALCDADATWQIVQPLLQELHDQPRLERLYFDHVNPTTWHIYQMERPGILIDEEQRAQLFAAYEPVYEQMLERVRDAIRWPGFNPASNEQLKTLLFYGCTYKDPKPPPPGSPFLLRLQPIFNTDKYPQDWADIVEKGEERFNTPGVGAEALELLYARYKDREGYQEKAKILKQLKHLSVIGKFLSTYLAPQAANEYGVPGDGKGLQNNIWRDGRVRTHISQMTATGRNSSSKANLQTKPKKQEAAAFEALVDFYFGTTVSEYKKRCDPDYRGSNRIEPRDQIMVPKFASCFVARPGYCLIEADFATAEVFIWAYASGDPALIKLVESGRDAHSENTAKSFDLPERSTLPDVLAALEGGDPGPYEAWCDNIKTKYGALRIAAKAVLFGFWLTFDVRLLKSLYQVAFESSRDIWLT